MKKILGLLILISISQLGFSTGQVPDYLVVGNDTIAIFSNPLEQYFEKVGNREIIGLKGCGSTACWRGYKAIWKLQNDSLFLTAITSCHTGDWCTDTRDADLDLMFGDDYKNNSVFASWVTGEIMAPKGELVQYIHMGYASVYEQEQIFTFKSGIKTKVKIKSNRKLAREARSLKKARIIQESVPDTMYFYVKNNLDWDTLKTPYLDLCDDKYILTYNRRGKIKKTWVDWEGITFSEKVVDWWWNITEDKDCRKKMKEAIKPLNLSYLDLPKKRFKITITILYDKSGELKIW